MEISIISPVKVMREQGHTARETCRQRPSRLESPSAVCAVVPVCWLSLEISISSIAKTPKPKYSNSPIVYESVAEMQHNPLGLMF